MEETNELLHTLIFKRGNAKAQLTRFCKYIDEFDFTKASITEIKKRLEKIECITYNTFNEIQTEIESITDTENDERESFENKYYAYVSRAVDIIENSQQPIETNNGNISDNTSSLNNIKLPTIKLPQFSGAMDTWLEFYDIFDSLITQNAQLNQVQKLHYLKSCLSGEAAQVIISMKTSSANFEIAWNLLCERYNNKRLLIHNHIKALFNLQTVNKESAIQLRSLIDNVKKHLRCLESLGQVIQGWDPLLIYLITSKLDSATIREWEEESHKMKDFPTLEDFLIVVKNKADLLETIAVNTSAEVNKSSSNKQNIFFKNSSKQKTFLSSKFACSLCKQPHRLFKCEEFQKLSVKQRNEHVKKLNICKNCLNSGHLSDDCRFGPCKKCPLKHNSLLHVENNSNNVETSTVNNTENRSTSLTSYVNQGHHTLLSTALVKIMDNYGQTHTCRVLLDSGSESSFITEHLFEKLGLKKRKYNISILGIGESCSQVKYNCDVDIHAMHSGFSSKVSCLIIPNICEQIPTHKINSLLNIPTNIFLADPQFHTPSSIDMLIGANLFWSLLCVGQIKLGDGLPIIQKTKLGWIISGPVNTFYNSKISRCNFTKNSEIENQLEKFWKIQEMHFSETAISQEEVEFENHFISTFKRDKDGKFIVTIPFKDNIQCLGNSSENAKKRFLKLENKLSNNSKMREKYVNFMNEYIKLNHMSKVTNDFSTQTVNFLPHHGILKEDSLTTKLRVVFDGSCPTSSGVSLNQIQMSGAVIQDDLFAILLRFRQYSFIVSSDIEKMYRCIWINPEQRPLQQILWRENRAEPLDSFQLNTVTYGTTSASFLAIRCLHQLSIDNADKAPLAAKAIAKSFYVDDFLHGSDSSEELSNISFEVFSILREAGFNLRKWLSNDPAIIKNIQEVDTSTDILKLGPTENSKTLGIFWSANADCLSFKITEPSKSKTSTKRSILSGVSQIYDPLGILSACLISIKILLQNLWLEKLSWDESVSIAVHTKWSKFRQEIIQLESLRIPRHVKFKNSVITELHGFCDASQNAYAACIYVRSVNDQGEIMVRLLCAKSKVAPLKTITIPKLELQGALILCRLMKKVQSSLELKSYETFYWTDSTIVLGWLKTSPRLLKIFVGNRVSEIQSNSNIDMWKHVKSEDNPADLASRGVSPSFLLTSDMWWYGPEWLSRNKSEWPLILNTSMHELPELKSVTLVSKLKHFVFPFERFSNYSRLINCIAYCLRFSHNCKNRTTKSYGPLTVAEIKLANLAIIRIIQKQHFALEYSALSQAKPLPPKSSILSLNPILIDDIIRVGGRLKNSKFDYDKKHPILLPKGHYFVKLLFLHEHKRLLHAGPNQLLFSIRDHYWPISGKCTAKQVVHSCVRCFRSKPYNLAPLMGDLPSERVTPSPPFSSTGIDYAGPFNLKDRRGRGSRLIKGYVSLFICLTTKAIHLELVTELTASSFIAALRRFISRRGKPTRILSDNGTNFVGAKNELETLGNFLQVHKEKIVEAGALEGISWIFIPPYSPHFGGIWESGVKSMKFHLKRIMGNANLVYEDFLTILIQIEGILNSRPLSPLSSDPNDVSPLTPSHFLIGRPIMSLPESDFQDVPENRLTRFQYMQRLTQNFWAKWSSEYISELQSRKKWRQNQHTLSIGTLVLIKDKNQPPLCWALGRVQQLHPGKDQISRVASVQTSKGVVKRAVINLCPLPMDNSDNV